MVSSKIICVTLTLLCCIVFFTSAFTDNSDSKNMFESFKHKYNKNYETPEEEQKRFQIFKDNLIKSKELEELNGGSAQFGVTKFSDLTSEEFSAKYLIKNVPSMIENLSKQNSQQQNVPAEGLSCKPNPVSYDWGINCGVVTPPQNQGQCGASVAIVLAEAYSSYCALAGLQLEQYSTQQIIDCEYPGEGCDGTTPQAAWEYIISAGGLETESQYPYTGEPASCVFNSSNVDCYLKSYTEISGGELGLYNQISSAKGGPIAVCLDAASWQSYSGGILTSCGNEVDHCAFLTGYGSYGESGAFWNVLNSWGEDWGQNGYIWIAIGQDLCGIADDASFPVVSVA